MRRRHATAASSELVGRRRDGGPPHHPAPPTPDQRTQPRTAGDRGARVPESQLLNESAESIRWPHARIGRPQRSRVRYEGAAARASLACHGDDLPHTEPWPLPARSRCPGRHRPSPLVVSDLRGWIAE